VKEPPLRLFLDLRARTRAPLRLFLHLRALGLDLRAAEERVWFLHLLLKKGAGVGFFEILLLLMCSHQVLSLLNEFSTCSQSSQSVPQLVPTTTHFVPYALLNDVLLEPT
jgi:hypothetical protein